MKQEEKNQLSKEKILQAAIKEFGTKTYEKASLNTICNENNLSKGLIYHYFKNKDSLYLSCVQSCFNAFTQFMRKESAPVFDIQKEMKSYLHSRYSFFKENPYFSYIFFNTIFQPPAHLIKEIKVLRREFDTLNLNHYQKIVKTVTLREKITEEDALDYFLILQEIFNNSFQNKTYEASDFNTLVEDHEIKLSKILDMMLYGIAKEV